MMHASNYAQLTKQRYVAETRTLFVSWTRTNLGYRALNAAGPPVWNYLPIDGPQTSGLVIA